MTTPSVVSAVLCQLDTTLRLVETMSPSLSAEEISSIRGALQRSYCTMGGALQSRNLAANGADIYHEFGKHPLNFWLTLFLIATYVLITNSDSDRDNSKPPARRLATHVLRRHCHIGAPGTVLCQSVCRQPTTAGMSSNDPRAGNPIPILNITDSDDKSTPGRFALLTYIYS